MEEKDEEIPTKSDPKNDTENNQPQNLENKIINNDSDKKEKKEIEEEKYIESKEPFMQIFSKDLLPLLNIKENRYCFDCEFSPANWICVNNSIFLCSKCAGIHRTYGPIISNLKLITIDKLNEFQIEIMKIGGNKKLKELLSKYNIDIKNIDFLELFSSNLLEYHREYLYNKLSGKNEPKIPSKFEALKTMTNFKDKRPFLEKPIYLDENQKLKNENQNKDNNDNKKNCKVQ